MANNQIGKYGGKIEITASSTPTGHTITGTSPKSWITDVMTGTSWSANVETNGTDKRRSCQLSVTITTEASSSYNPESTAITCGFTITQEAGDAPSPTPTTSVTVTFTNNGAETCWAKASLGVGDWDEFTLDYNQSKSSSLEIDDSTFIASITISCRFIDAQHSNPVVYYSYGSSGTIALGSMSQENTDYDFQTPELTYIAGTNLTITIG